MIGTPETPFLEDLDKAIAKWLESGDQLVVGGDFNHKITEAPIIALFEKHGMSNIILPAITRIYSHLPAPKSTATSALLMASLQPLASSQFDVDI